MLRQLHTLLSRCLTSYAKDYDVILIPLIKVVKELPFSADDVWHTRNAQGTFADALKHFAEVRSKPKAAGDKVCSCCRVLRLLLL